MLTASCVAWHGGENCQPVVADGQRPNRQVRIIGDAVLTRDEGGVWTARVWAKYRRNQPDHDDVAQRLQGRDRMLISVRPARLIALASV